MSPCVPPNEPKVESREEGTVEMFFVSDDSHAVTSLLGKKHDEAYSRQHDSPKQHTPLFSRTFVAY